MLDFRFRDDDGSLLLYSLELKYSFVSREIKFGYSCNFIRFWLDNGINKVETIEICEVVAYIDKITVVCNREKNLPEIIAKTVLINHEYTRISSHIDVILELAISYWMSIGVNAFNFCQIDDIGWIIITNLWEQSQLETHAYEDFQNPKLLLPLSEKSYWMAIIESAKQLPNNSILLQQLSNIPKEYEKFISSQLKNNKITEPTEPSYYELFMDEQKAAGRGFD
ncbi:hypothetical protein [Nostoc sp.]|uniref:hypothetical protein n=1 Tax=Nostoc sp. TaxID=1180 RepID=UPI002FFB4975